MLSKTVQSFFTSIPVVIEPTGQGTGLGLSLAYDIVKVYGGELSVGLPSEKVETKEGEGSGLIVNLPVN